MDEIKMYLETGHLPTDVEKAQKLQVRDLKYALIERILYKKLFFILYLRCLTPNEAREALREVHEGVRLAPWWKSVGSRSPVLDFTGQIC